MQIFFGFFSVLAKNESKHGKNLVSFYMEFGDIFAIFRKLSVKNPKIERYCTNFTLRCKSTQKSFFWKSNLSSEFWSQNHGVFQGKCGGHFRGTTGHGESTWTTLPQVQLSVSLNKGELEVLVEV